MNSRRCLREGGGGGLLIIFGSDDSIRFIQGVLFFILGFIVRTNPICGSIINPQNLGFSRCSYYHPKNLNLSHKSLSIWWEFLLEVQIIHASSHECKKLRGKCLRKLCHKLLFIIEKAKERNWTKFERNSGLQQLGKIVWL